jgi:hypothetical protein
MLMSAEAPSPVVCDCCIPDDVRAGPEDALFVLMLDEVARTEMLLG